MEEKREIIIEKYYKLIINEEAKKSVITKAVKELQDEYETHLKSCDDIVAGAHPAASEYLNERVEAFKKDNHDPDYIKYLLYHKRQLNNSKLLVERQLKNFQQLRHREKFDVEFDDPKRKNLIKIDKVKEYLKSFLPNCVTERVSNIIFMALLNWDKSNREFYINSWLAEFHIYLKESELKNILKLIDQENTELP